MAVLRSPVLAAVIVAGCYEPDFRECVVACADDSDCGPGQVCGADRLCLAEASSRRCDRERIDAGAPRDAHEPAVPDAGAPPPDAATRFQLVVKVSGKGRVLVPGFGACRDACAYQVLGGPIVLQAIPDEDWRHDEWGDACDDTESTTCALVITSSVTASSKFRKLDN